MVAALRRHRSGSSKTQSSTLWILERFEFIWVLQGFVGVHLGVIGFCRIFAGSCKCFYQDLHTLFVELCILSGFGKGVWA